MFQVPVFQKPSNPGDNFVLQNNSPEKTEVNNPDINKIFYATQKLENEGKEPNKNPGSLIFDQNHDEQWRNNNNYQQKTTFDIPNNSAWDTKGIAFS